MSKANPNKQYLPSGQVCARYGGRSDMWISRLLKRDATFPRPIRVGRFLYWSLDELEAYERAITAQQRTA
jgi:predicted DNA-binding transcriptional regulator AlpA